MGRKCCTSSKHESTCCKSLSVPLCTNTISYIAKSYSHHISCHSVLFLKLTFFIMYFHIFGPITMVEDLRVYWRHFQPWHSMVVWQLLFSSLRHLDVVRHGGRINLCHMSIFDLVLFVSQSVVGLAIHIAVLILPTIAVMQLQLPRRRNIGIVLIFMTGLLLVDLHGLRQRNSWRLTRTGFQAVGLRRGEKRFCEELNGDSDRFRARLEQYVRMTVSLSDDCIVRLRYAILASARFVDRGWQSDSSSVFVK